MLRRQLLSLASEAVGHEIPPWTLRYARKQGFVSDAIQRPDGYYEFGDKHLDELVSYIRNRSRVVPSDPGFQGTDVGKTRGRKK